MPDERRGNPERTIKGRAKRKVLLAFRRMRAWMRKLRRALSPPDEWEAAELYVAARLEQHLQSYVKLAIDLDELAFDIAQKAALRPQLRPLFNAHSTLLARVLHDTRVVLSSASNGYTMQAWTIAATSFEAAHMMGFINVDNARAEAWLAHKDPRHSFKKVFPCVKETFRFLEIGETAEEMDARITMEYKEYTLLCVAKHVNPMAESKRYIGTRGSIPILAITPFYSVLRAKEARRGIVLACRAAVLGIWVFRRVMLVDDSEFDDRLTGLTMEMAELMINWSAVSDSAT